MTLEHTAYQVKEKFSKLNKSAKISKTTKTTRFRFYYLIKEVRILMRKEKKLMIKEKKILCFKALRDNFRYNYIT